MLLWRSSVAAPAVYASLPPLPASIAAAPVSGASVVLSKLVLGPLPKAAGHRIDLRFLPVAQVVDLIYADMLDAPYVIDPEVLADTRLVSFRFDTEGGDLRQFLSVFLGSLGYMVRDRGGVDYVSKSSETREEVDKQTFVYAPLYRNADYLSRLVQPLLKGRLVQNHEIATPDGEKSKGDAPPGSAAALLDQSADVLVYSGSSRDIEVLKKLLPQLDTPVGNVVIRAWVYEVTETNDNNSAFQLALSVLGGRVGASLNVGTVAATDNAVRLSVGGFSAALSALNSDSRFKVLTSPNLRVKSGDTASLNVGESVPVVGSVSYPSSTAAPVQSVVYQDAGVIFQVQPTVKRDAIDLHLVEEISNFTNTTTGVNNSPTKNTRKVDSSFTLADGDVLLIGGLTQDQDTRVNTGLSFLPRWMAGHTLSKNKTEILLLLQVQKL